MSVSQSAHPNTEDVLQQMIDFVQDAAVVALEARARGLEVTHKGEGLGQALTEADEAISRMMGERFGPRVIEEETAARLSFEQCRTMLAGDEWSFVGDPIDGTRPFAGGLAAWGTMIGACRRGWPVAGVLSLPAWVDQRDHLGAASRDLEPRGVILAAAEGVVRWAPTRAGRVVDGFARLSPSTALSHHTGWLPVAAKNFTLDYTQGFFPLGESASVSDAANLLTGRLDTTSFNASLWDVAAAVPAFEAMGFGFFAWPDLAPAPKAIIDMFADDLSSGERLWLVAKDAKQAGRLAAAITRAK